MRFGLLAMAVLCTACTSEPFDYQAQIRFDPSVGPVLLNHQPIASGDAWIASYSTYADAMRDPPLVELGGQIVSLSPGACLDICGGGGARPADLCHDFDRAELTFTLHAEPVASASADGACTIGDDTYLRISG